jgi:hypothetical protein
MSGGTSPPDDPHGTPGDAGYGTQPGYAPQRGPRDGYEPRDWREADDADDAYPRRGHPIRRRLAITAGVVVAAVIIAGAFVYVLHKKATWTLAAPQTVAGLSRDANPPGQLGLSSLLARFKSDVTSLPGYGSLTSTVGAAYALGANQAVAFIGFNGSFNVQVALKNGPGLEVSNVNPGPHGGTAECGTSGQEAICQWSTNSTVGFIVVLPTNGLSVSEPARDAASLLLRFRNDVERKARHSYF